jgi:MFS family permease
MQLRLTGLARNTDFAKLWTAQTISQFGSRITREGLPLAAVLNLAASPAQMGILTALSAAPVLVVGLFAGVLVDRLRRRPLMILADVGRAVLLLTIPLAAFQGWLSITQLYLIAILTGILTVLFDVADQSYLPSVVKREDLVDANSKLGASSSLAEIGGPPMAGVLIQLLTAPIAIIFDAVSFLVSALFIGWLRSPDPRPETSAEQPNLWREVREGVSVILSHPTLRALALVAAVSTFFGNFYWPLYSLYAIRELGLSTGILGVLIGLGGVGAFGGAFVASWAARRFGVGPAIVGSRMLASLISPLTVLAGGPLWLIILCMGLPQLLGDGAMMVYFINQTSLRQTLIPDHLLGRANASMAVIVGGLGPLGALAGGFLGTALGVRPTLALAVAGLILAAVALLLSPVRHAEMPTSSLVADEPVGAFGD